jgi:hypothetical protein
MIGDIFLLPPAMVGDHSKEWDHRRRWEPICNILHRDGETARSGPRRCRGDRPGGVSAEANLRSPLLEY